MPIEVESPEEMGYDTIAFNLTESSMRDQRFGDLGVELDDLVLAYDDHLGNPRMRTLVAADVNASLHTSTRFPGLTALAATGPAIWPATAATGPTPVGADHVMLLPGAAAALFCLHMALLGPGDEVVVVRPNYGTNLETPRALGAAVKVVDLDPARGWAVDPDAIAAATTPNTRLISITNPHNPTGAVIDEAALREIAATAARVGALLLVDETYRDLSFAPPAPWAATLGDHVISIASLSKAYGLPGIRMGWLVTTDPALREQLLAVKEQMIICGSALDEAVAAHAFGRRADILLASARVAVAHAALVDEFVAGHSAQLALGPSRGGGVVCFPEIIDRAVDIDAFYRILNETHGCYVGPGHWFEQPRRFFRLGFGWPLTDELVGGLDAIDAALAAARA